MSVHDPRAYRVADTLRDGTAVTIRAIRPDDKGRLHAALGGLEAESIYTRFFSHRGTFSDEELRAATEVDFRDTVALVVTVPDGEGGETIIGAGRYVRIDPPGSGRAAEVAFTVEEDYQGRGIAGRILRHLAEIAREQGLAELTAEVLPTNRAMLAVFARSGLPMRRSPGDGVEHVALLLAGESAAQGG